MSVFQNIADKILKKGQGGNTETLEPIDDSRDQSPDEQKLVEYVKGRIDLVRNTNSRIALENIFITNIAYTLGYNGVMFDSTYKQFKNVDPKRRLSRNQFKVNKILPTVQNRLARLTQTPPQFDVRPNSNTTDDKDAANLSLEILIEMFQKLKFEEKRQEFLLTAMEGGVGYCHVKWDDMAGEPMVDPENPENLAGYEGDVALEPLNCLEVFVDPLAKSMDEAQWLIIAKVRKLDYFKERYPERGAAVKEESAWLLSAIYDLKINSLTAVGIIGTQTNDQSKDAAIEIIYEEKRSTKFPNGRRVVVANGVLLEDKDLPVGEFDVVKFDDILVAGRFHSESVVTHLRPIQDQYNVLRTKMADWTKKMLAGKYIAAKGHGLNQEALNNDSGEVVEYNPVPDAAPPSAMITPMIPNYVFEDLNTLDAEFNNISGLQDVSQGMAPSASMPWRGMALLQEQDQTKLSVITSRNEHGYAAIGRLILLYISKYYVMPRVFKLAGDSMEYTVKEFMGADLKDNTDVMVVPGSTAPTSKVLKRQDIINAYQMGLLGNPQDPMVRQKVLAMMEFGDETDIWKSHNLDMAQVRETIKKLEASEMPDMHEWDNHGLFIQELNDYRKTDKFQQMSVKQQAMLNYVVEWHLQALVNIMNPQLPQQQILAQHMVDQMHMMQAQGGAPGMPGGPTGGPGMAIPNNPQTADVLSQQLPMSGVGAPMQGPPPMLQNPMSQQTPAAPPGGV